MRAAQHETYNKNNIKLTMVETNQPNFSNHQVLIKVITAGVNPLDNMISRGEVKMIVPYQLPQIAGNEVVGIIEQKGSDVKNFDIGDRVFSRLPLTAIGAFAEYIAVDDRAIAKVPHYLSDIEAAAVPLTALTVMQAFELMKVEPGKTIFISGGTGGVGAIAIPLAKAKGLTVITNGNGASEKRMMQLGVDQFIDYKKEDYINIVNQVDYVLDTVGGDETKKQLSILKKGGHLVSLKGMPNAAFAKRMNLSRWKQMLFKIAGLSLDREAKKLGVHYHFMFVESNGLQLQEVAEIFDQFKISPSIDTVYPFSRINVALDKVANGHSRGKTVIVMDAHKH